MSSKAKHYAASSAARPATKGHAKAEARKRSRQRYTQSQGLPWFKITVGVVAVVLIAAFAFSFVNTGYGKISAQSTSYAFGDVPWKGGFVYTKFPITVEGDTTVNDIQSTWTCTKARLVQANNTSDWFGMAHERGAAKPNIKLVAGQPAYLEVRIDPAAHGQAGIGPWQRGIAVSTAGGQRLEFALTANVTP